MKAALAMAAVFLLGASAFVSETGAEEKKWSDEGELSYVSTSGNTKVTSFAAKNQLKGLLSDRLLGTWRVGALTAETNDVKTAENYFTDVKLDYQFTESFYSFAAAGWLKNKFSGIDRRVNGGIGGGYKFLNGPSHFLVGELGVNYVADRYTDGTRKDYPGGRAFGKYTYAFTEKNKASQSVEYLVDFKDTENYDVNAETAVISGLSGNLSLKAAYLVNYRNKPVPATLKRTDATTTVALVINY